MSISGDPILSSANGSRYRRIHKQNVHFYVFSNCCDLENKVKITKHWYDLEFVNIHIGAIFDENRSKTFEVILNTSPNCTFFRNFSLRHGLENQVKVTKIWYDLEFVNIHPRVKCFDNQSRTFEVILHRRQRCTIFHFSVHSDLEN